MQYPDNARENRQQFMLDFIMTGKIQVHSNAWLAPRAQVHCRQLFIDVCMHCCLHGSFAKKQCHFDQILQKSTPNLEAAFKYLKQNVGNKPFTPEVVLGLEEAAGVGVVITPEQIDATVDRHISSVKSQLQEQRYAAVKQLLQQFKSLL